MQKNLILIMKDRGVKNKELAQLLGISEKQMGLKIKGKSDFKSTEMFIISEYFKLPMDKIFLPSMYENRTKN